MVSFLLLIFYWHYYYFGGIICWNETAIRERNKLIPCAFPVATFGASPIRTACRMSVDNERKALLDSRVCVVSIFFALPARG